MFSVFQIDFAGLEFAWAVCCGLILTFVLRKAVHHSHRMLRSLATRPLFFGVVLASVMFALQLFVVARFGWPVPALHDEFSYLLAADTFASGRATNPTHPAWEFLETYHVLWQPSCQSKYPPGNGLVLALGQVLTGRPIVGTWICLAGAVTLAFWMLRGWFSTVWAVSGAGILICNWPITKHWGQTFYGGAPALLGGMLLFGAAARLRVRPGLSNACWFSLGLVVLAVTRPYEGLLASLPIVSLLLYQFIKGGNEYRSRWIRLVAVPATVILTLGFLILGWYHWRVTLSPWLWPYRLYEMTYSRRTNAFNTLLSFTELGPRSRTIPSLEYESSAVQMRFAETRPVIDSVLKIVRQWWVQIGLLASLPFSVAAYQTFVVWRLSGKARGNTSRIPSGLALLTITIVGIGILLQRTAGHPHYAAPIQPLILLLIVQGLRLLRTVRFGRYRIGPDLVSWFIWSMMLFLLLPLLTGINRPNVRPWSRERDRIQTELMQRERPQLVIIRYGAKHSMHEEWVYNRADIERAQVVWARDLGAARTMELLNLFPGREVSIVQPDDVPILAIPYTHRDEDANLPKE